MAATVAPASTGAGFPCHPQSASSATVEEIIRTAVMTNRIRMIDTFRDFDPLRSGYVTCQQFHRILTQTLRMTFSDDQIQYLIQTYGRSQPGRIDYMSFCSVIDGKFDPNLLTKDPSLQKNETREFLGTVRSICPLSLEEEDALESLLRRLIGYYNYNGIVLKTCYCDFDRHHKGVVTESQFYRNFPGPESVGVEEMHLLVKKYGDPSQPGMVNYLNFHHDLEALKHQKQPSILEKYKSTDLGDYIQRVETGDPTLHDIFDKIKVAVFKNGVRTPEYFKDHDKLRHGIITDNQFVCGLSLAIGKEASLTRAEIQKVVEHYRTPDGRVRYKEFCDMMENAFNVPNLEKKPTQEMSRPPRGALGRPFISEELNEKERDRAEVLLREISDRVRRRRVMMYQYFKDYDRSQGYTRIVTETQFRRILHFLSLDVNNEDFKLLKKMFADISTGDINYPAFVQAVDAEFTGKTVEEVPPTEEEVDEARPGSSDSQKAAALTAAAYEVNLDDLMVRIRHIVLTNRYRVCEYFQDFDPLNSGSITIGQFRRGLASLSLSKLGQHDLTDGQFHKLCLYYANPAKPDQVLWKNFMADVESVFTQPNLEKTPLHRVPPQEMFRVPNPGTVDWRLADDRHREVVEATLSRLRERINQRRVLVKPVFSDFDRHSEQHVTRNQFRQCLTILELHCSVPEMDALEAKYCDDSGFHYANFLHDLEPAEQPQLMYKQRLADLRRINQERKLPEIDPRTDLEGVLEKIKTKVCKERIRVIDLIRDYDKLNHGRVKTLAFRRALDLGRFSLTESELSILEDHYRHHIYADYVDYRRFCDEIESIFTKKDLEKAPLDDVEQYKPADEAEVAQLSPEHEQALSVCVDKLAERVKKMRMQLFPLFEDFDRVHNGTVSRSQFRRVLTELNLGCLVTDQEFLLIYQKFYIKVGGRDDVNYIAFCHAVYARANFDWTKP